MRGAGHIRFSDLFADTIETHGVVWAREHYLRRGMSAAEFGHWCMVYAHQRRLLAA